MTLPIPKLELERLAKLCGMFGSDAAGERAAAALKADELVRRHGLTWFDVLIPKQNRLAGAALEMKLAIVRDNLGRLSAWERGFVRSLGKFPYLSDKQMKVLDRLVAKVSEERCAA